jgi:hypothetical protein
LPRQSLEEQILAMITADACHIILPRKQLLRSVVTRFVVVSFVVAKDRWSPRFKHVQRMRTPGEVIASPIRCACLQLSCLQLSACVSFRWSLSWDVS